MDPELNDILSKNFPGKIGDKFRNYKDCLVLDAYERIADSIENFEVRNDDVWVCSFPKSGTTWAQEMVWSIANGLNSEGSENSISIRFPYLEFSGTFVLYHEMAELAKTNPKITNMLRVEDIANSPSPRFIKTHLPFHLLPRQLREREKNCKIVYVSRNPKDTCISYYHYYKVWTGYFGTFENFSKLLLADKVLHAPYWTNVNSYVKRKDDNILCIKFEDMKSDLRSVINQVATFLDKKLDEDQVASLEDHLSFASMKKNPTVNRESVYKLITDSKWYGENVTFEQPFMRSGLTGEWKSVMSEELVKQFDDWIDENSN